MNLAAYVTNEFRINDNLRSILGLRLEKLTFTIQVPTITRCFIQIN